jgi:hypothetical protein
MAEAPGSGFGQDPQSCLQARMQVTFMGRGSYYEKDANLILTTIPNGAMTGRVFEDRDTWLQEMNGKYDVIMPEAKPLWTNLALCAL